MTKRTRPPVKKKSAKKKLNYSSSGVNIDRGDALVDWLQKTDHSSRSPFAKNVMAGIGGFAALYRFQHPEIKKPVLVTSTDGVGTKVKLASHFQDFSGIGQDLVAMCVNDLLTVGATPLFFLDYYATGHLNLRQSQAFLQSVRRACDESECILIGGETAEMPGVYAKNDFDCAGFVVGVVDEDHILGPARVKAGDVAIGISSSGFHSNGYSLLRKVFQKDLKKWKDTLLTPTHLYVQLAKKVKPLVHAMANITGGGVHNIPRVLPPGMSLKLRHWTWPEAFLEVQRRTKMTEAEMLKTLNCGVGLCVIATKENRNAVLKEVHSLGFETYDMGEIVPSQNESKSDVLF